MKHTFPKLLLLLVLCLALAGIAVGAYAAGNVRHPAKSSDTVVVYEQPHDGSGKLLQSSWWDPDGSDYDQYVWDDFTLASAQDITEIRWRGGYDPSHFGMGGRVITFTVAIYPSIAANIEPDIVHPPLVRHVAGNGGETPAGAFGGVALYDYAFALPRPFHAEAGVKYWVQIEGWQHGIPDWGLAAGTGGSGGYFRRIAGMGDAYYQRVSGDAAFALLAAGSASSDTPTPTATAAPTDTPTPTGTTAPTDTPTPTATPAAWLYLPLLSRSHAP